MISKDSDVDRCIDFRRKELSELDEKTLSLVNQSCRWYGFDSASKPYHNQQHAVFVMDSVCEICENTPGIQKTSDALILAALWHDAVYIPGVGGNYNEVCSAQALVHTARRLCVEDISSVTEAARLIRLTSIDEHLRSSVPATIGQAILADADLESLSVPDFGVFVANQKNIITENYGNPSCADDLRKSAEFLYKFLSCREHIYHTEYARRHWELMARSNIERWCRLHIPDASGLKFHSTFLPPSPASPKVA